jgi:hypothetical protein
MKNIEEDTIHEAMACYASSHGAWQRYLRREVLSSGIQNFAGLQEELARAGKAALHNDEPGLGAKYAAAALNLPWMRGMEERAELLETFCSCWFKVRPTAARQDVVTLIIEAYGRNVPSLVHRRHQIIDVIRECLVIDPAFAQLVIAMAGRHGIQEQELRS